MANLTALLVDKVHAVCGANNLLAIAYIERAHIHPFCGEAAHCVGTEKGLTIESIRQAVTEQSKPVGAMLGAAIAIDGVAAKAMKAVGRGVIRFLYLCCGSVEQISALPVAAYTHLATAVGIDGCNDIANTLHLANLVLIGLTQIQTVVLGAYIEAVAAYGKLA